MTFRKPLLVLAMAGGLAACNTTATPYKPNSSAEFGGIAGGYQERQTANGLWHVMFASNGYTSHETAQTYWLYHCAEIALARGYDGFQIVSKMNLTLDAIGQRGVQVAAGAPILIPMDMGPGPMSADGTIYHLIGDIRLVKAPFSFAPPKSFDARLLKARLESYVHGEKCERGNVCEHPHDYLHLGR